MKIALIMMFFAALSAQSLLSADVPLRVTIPLDGEWKFHPRPSDVGEGGRHAFEQPDKDRSPWRTIRVPSCWERQFEDLKYYEGVGWYSRTFEFEGDPAAVHAELVFEGVNYLSRVYLNGRTLADHEGGYTEFRVPVGDALLKGENHVAVRVDNRRHLLRIPAHVGWQNYGGIYRPVRLEVTPALHLSELYTRTLSLDREGAVIEVSARINAPETTALNRGAFAVEVLNSQGRTVGSLSLPFTFNGSGTDVRGTLAVRARDVRAWTPETPHLYLARASLLDGKTETDRNETKFGIRTVGVDGRDFLLNGKPRKVRGICYHVDFPRTGRSFDPEVWETDLANFRELGVNALRCHYPLDRRMLDDLDSLGIMVWMENAMYWVHDYDRDRLALGRAQLREIAVAHRNHPSVVVWSLGNECGFDPHEEVLFFGALREELRRLVPDAISTYASNSRSDNPSNWSDIYSANMYAGWYTFLGRRPVQLVTDSTQLAEAMDNMRKELHRRAREFPVMPFWASEFGGDAALDIPRGDWELFSENYQAMLLKSQIEMIASVPEFSGLFPWLYNDFYDPVRMEAPGQDGKNLKGVVTIERRKKKSFQVLKEFYSRWGRD